MPVTDTPNTPVRKAAQPISGAQTNWQGKKHDEAISRSHRPSHQTTAPVSSSASSSHGRTLPRQSDTASTSGTYKASDQPCTASCCRMKISGSQNSGHSHHRLTASASAPMTAASTKPAITRMRARQAPVSSRAGRWRVVDRLAAHTSQAASDCATASAAKPPSAAFNKVSPVVAHKQRRPWRAVKPASRPTGMASRARASSGSPARMGRRAPARYTAAIPKAVQPWRVTMMSTLLCSWHPSRPTASPSWAAATD